MVTQFSYAPLKIEGIYNEGDHISIACAVIVISEELCTRAIKMAKDKYDAAKFFIEIHFDPFTNAFTRAGLFYDLEYLSDVPLNTIGSVIEILKSDGKSLDAFIFEVESITGKSIS